MKTILILLALAGLTNASTITATLESVAPSLTVTGSVTGGSPTGVWSGQLNFDKFNAFCVGPDQEINLGETVTYTTIPMTDLSYGTGVAQVISKYLVSSKDAEQAAGAQWAIWYLIAGSNVYISPGQSTAVVMADYLSTYSAYQPADATFLESSTRQSMVALTPVPEPSYTVLLGAAALLTLRRKR